MIPRRGEFKAAGSAVRTGSARVGADKDVSGQSIFVYCACSPSPLLEEGYCIIGIDENELEGQVLTDLVKYSKVFYALNINNAGQQSTYVHLDWFRVYILGIKLILCLEYKLIKTSPRIIYYV